MSTEAESSPSDSWAFDVTKTRCPMCGASIDETAPHCPQCGEELETSTSKLTVPIFSLTAIGVCTFFWTFLTGMILVWMNCRRLGWYEEANRTTGVGIGMLLVFMAILVIPDFPGGDLIIALVWLLAVTQYAKALLKEPLSQQRQQGGPYRSIWLGHGIGFMVVVALLMFVFSAIAALNAVGMDVEF